MCAQKKCGEGKETRVLNAAFEERKQHVNNELGLHCYRPYYVRFRSRNLVKLLFDEFRWTFLGRLFFIVLFDIDISK